MNYKPITFTVPAPVDVDWGDGNFISYPAGEITGTPVGEVIVQSDQIIEDIEFNTDNISQVNFEEAKDLKYANEMFKNNKGIQVVYFDKNSPIETVRSAFADSSIVYFGDLYFNRPRQLQYLALRASKLECIEGLNTTNAFNAYGMLQDSKLEKRFPKETLRKLENTDEGGCRWFNPEQCIHQIYQFDWELNDSTIQNYFVDTIETPKDYSLFISGFNGEIPEPPVTAKCTLNNVSTDSVDGFIFNGNNSYIKTSLVPDRDKGTIAMMVKRNQADRNYDTLFINSYSSDRYRAIIDSNGKVRFMLDTTITELYSNTTIPANQWFHIAIAFDLTSFEIYINGVLDAETTGSILFDSHLWVYDMDNLYIGGNDYFSDMSGAMKNIRVYDRKLSSQEITAIYNEDNI